MPRAWTWTPFQIEKLNNVKEVLSELEQYKPLTLRQVYYQLVSKEYIENNKSQYGMLSQLLTAARLEGLISWHDIEDRTRPFHRLTGFENMSEFVEYSLDDFLSGYSRNLLQTQNKYIEVWIEKDALSTLFYKVCRQYAVSLVVCRGFNSMTALFKYKERLRYCPDKEPVILYFGDFDPSGVEMTTSTDNNLRERLGIENIQVKRIALQKEHIFKYKLPHNPDALKKTDKRSKKFVELNGEIAVELDALRPEVLENMISEAIENEIDLELFEKEKQKQEADFNKINEQKEKATKTLKSGLFE